MLFKKDAPQIENLGMSVASIEEQLQIFKNGIPPASVITAASVGNGIEIIAADEQQKIISLYDEKCNSLDVIKFVPASGAATRMFKFLHEYLSTYNPETDTWSEYLKSGNHTALQRFANSFNDLACVHMVRLKVRELYPEYKQCDKGKRFQIIAKTMLEPSGLNFSLLPKGLIPFHKYTKYPTTAFEEQLYESAFYASVNGEAAVHFTFSEAHVTYFKNEFEAIKSRVTKKTKTEFHISYSFQKKETDTIAVKMNNKPFRDENNKLVFRPSGHGALIENLNAIEADIIFIKNIDNVTAEEYVPETAHYKKLLAGKLCWLQKKVFHFMEMLSHKAISEEINKEIRTFLWNSLNIKDIPNTTEGLREILNRPIRVCGVVKNTGAAGGGPFWIKDKHGQTTLQIIEISQIDLSDAHQQAIVNEATHFNPVDIVCGIRDYKGNKFDLNKFVDTSMGFITEKSIQGVPIKALELPGLWNGSMAYWNSVFIEVPAITFNPVKTVNDLFNKEHRPNA